MIKPFLVCVRDNREFQMKGSCKELSSTLAKITGTQMGSTDENNQQSLWRGL